MKYLVFILTVLFAACSGHDSIVDPNDCVEISTNSSFGFYIYSYPQNRYIDPCFNPNNANEFIYTKVNSETGIRELYKYNLENQSSTYLISNVLGRAKWGRTDWIIVELNDQNIWKLKGNGDSLTLVLQDGNYCNYPNWNARGDKFISRVHYGDSVNSVIVDLNGNKIIQTGTVIFDDGAWAPNNNNLIFPTSLDENYGIALCDTDLTESTNFVHMASQSGDDLLMGIEWLPDNQNVLWATKNTVSMTNVASGFTTQLISNCDSKHYIFPSISPDGSKILFERVNQSKVSEVELFIENKIVLMNIDGTDEVTILE